MSLGLYELRTLKLSKNYRFILCRIHFLISLHTNHFVITLKPFPFSMFSRRLSIDFSLCL